MRGLALLITGGFLISRANDPTFATLGRDELARRAKYRVWIVLVVVVAGRGLAAPPHDASAATSTPPAATPRRRGCRASASSLVRAHDVRDLGGLRRARAACSSPRGSRPARPTPASASSSPRSPPSSSAARRSSAARARSGARVLGVLLLALIGNGFNLLNVDPIYQQIVQGAIILARGRRSTPGARRTRVRRHAKGRQLMATRIGVDVGGTFTDLVWYDDATGEVTASRRARRRPAPRTRP